MATYRRQQSLTIDKAITKLREASELIQLREVIKPHERRRVEGAFVLLNGHSNSHNLKTAGRHNSFAHFVRKVHEACGPEFVALATIALGQSAIATMRETDRLRLPQEIKIHSQILTCSAVEKLANEIIGTLNRSSNQVLPSTQEILPVPAAVPRVQEQLHDKNPQNEGQPISSGSLSGRAFELTPEDARTIVMSSQFANRVWMTEPYDDTSLPFITITISKDTCLYFGSRRHQIM